MAGRWFGGRQLHASMYDGLTNFAAAAAAATTETAEEQEARLDAFAAELEGREAATAAPAAATGHPDA
eukprot:206326-Chlamydomonas_euryale.AAC.7